MRPLFLASLLVLGACKKDDPNAKGNDTDDSGETPEDLSVAIDDPGDGAWVKGNGLEVSGMVTGEAVFTVGGVDVESADDEWVAALDLKDAPWPDSGIWPVVAHAEDADGNWLRERITIMSGESVAAEDAVEDGLVLRLTDSAIDTVRPVLEDEIENLDLAAQLATGQPITSILGSDIYVDQASVTDITLDSLDFTPQGLSWGGTILDLDADVRFNIIFLGEFTGNLFIEETIATGHIVFDGDDDGALVATSGGTNVNLNGLTVTGFGSGSSAIVDALVNVFLSGFLGGEVESILMEQIDDALVLQDDLRTLDLGGVVLQSDFTGAVHDANGVNAYADTVITTENGTLLGDRRSNPNDAPSVTTAEFGGAPYGLGLFIDDDLISALGTGLAEGGLLNQELEGDLGGLTLDTTLLAGFVDAFDQLPADDPVTIELSATVPPIGSPGEGEAVRMGIGGLTLGILHKKERVMTVALDAQVGIDAGENLLDFDLIDTNATLLETTLDVPDPEEVEAPLDAMFQLVFPQVIDSALGAGGLEIDALEVLDSAPAGPGGDYAGMYFDLDLSGFLEEPAP